MDSDNTEIIILNLLLNNFMGKSRNAEMRNQYSLM